MFFASRRPAGLALPVVLAAVLLSGCGSSDTSVPTAPAPAASASSSASETTRIAAFDALEREYRARLGVYALDTGSGRTVTHRQDERFAHASTFKALQAAVVLRKASDEDLRRVVKYRTADLLEYAPITTKHVATGMTVGDLLAASVQYSDNTAANLLFKEVGGPAGLERELRELGDPTTNVDRIEPDLNEATPGDVRDTSTPRALGTDLQKFVLGDALPAERRKTFTDLLLGNTTGDTYIRAGVPDGWKVGDKTGSGGYGTRNDIAVIWPKTGEPIIIAVQSDRGVKDAKSQDALIAEATEATVAALR
ncbi:class A beta-lactamase [Actinoplanes sp. DH11]|uniref:class A beta-lactamase n=1 Tax=Actinoplanes sp. DH11 TaxID=2857011 RepID=UPI001E2C7457|nr:class A beta-lactamase [Actinoplanes sp. DH11]